MSLFDLKMEEIRASEMVINSYIIKSKLVDIHITEAEEYMSALYDYQALSTTNKEHKGYKPIGKLVI